MSATPEDLAQRFQVHTTSDSHFSWIRTRLSVERTMMSWLRTSVSLIGFGFTIVQFFERLGHMDNIAAALRPQAPRYLGLALIAAGVAVLLVSMWQYRWMLRYLWSPNFKPLAGIEKGPVNTPLLGAALVMLFIGLFAFFAVLTRAV